MIIHVPCRTFFDVRNNKETPKQMNQVGTELQALRLFQINGLSHISGISHICVGQ